MQNKKRRAIELLDAGKHLVEIAAELKMDITTIWRWRRGDQEFDKAVAERMVENDDERVKIVEGLLFQRIIRGECSATEMMRYLAYRAPERWQSKVGALGGLIPDGAGDGGDQISVTVLQQLVLRFENELPRVIRDGIPTTAKPAIPAATPD